MKCPKCQVDNREEAKFCSECGHKFHLICPDCGHANSPRSKFCDECGVSLTSQTKPTKPAPQELSFKEKLDKIQRYLPDGLTEKILAQKGKIEGERRQVTVMFCDMEGYTRISEHLGPEETYAIMNEIYEILIHKVHDYGGTVNELTGDGIMALFGAPIALEDAPQRAINAALAIHREMVKLREFGISDLGFRIGEKNLDKESLESGTDDKELQDQRAEIERKGAVSLFRNPQSEIPNHELLGGMRKESSGNAFKLRMRIGIHTGPVVVGTMGNDLRVDFKAVGDTVNLASRMESMAEPGTIFVTRETYQLAEGLFRFEAMGEREVKGKDAPVKVYRVIATSARRTRFDVNAERGLTPFVGRERELELLLDGFERARDGRGQAFSLVAEAGLGKSRLLYEFRKAVANEDATFLEGRCLSYHSGLSYYPISELLKSNFDIHETDSDSDIHEKVQKGLKSMGLEEGATLPYLLELLSLKESGLEKISMSPEARKERILEAVKRIVLKGSEIRPLILAIEDLHWIDRSSEEAIKYLLESITGSRVLLLFTYRPEFIPTWGGKSYHNQVTLNRLSNRESLAMLAYLLGAAEIEDNLESLILERTEGVPFFIEEFVKSLRDLSIIERKNGRYCLAKDAMAVAIPNTIQDVIMARVDKLPDEAKSALQTGSVIGREFSYEIIKKVTGLPERELLSHLSALKDSELLYERGIFPQSTYIFKHALTQKVVYDSILTARKKKLHQAAGDAMERLYRDKLDEYFGVLAEHYIIGEDYEKGQEYCNLMKRSTRKKASFLDAIGYAEKRIFCLEKLPQTELSQVQIIQARTDLGLLFLQISHYESMKKAIDPIVDLTSRLDYKKGLSLVYTILGVYYFSLDDLAKAIKYFEMAIRISGEVRDTTAFAFSNNYLGFTLASLCEYERAFDHFGKTLQAGEAAKSIWAVAVAKSNISYHVYFQQGKIDKAYKLAKEALIMAEESGDSFSKGFAYAFYGGACYGKGFLDEAEDYLLKSSALAQKINHYAVDLIAKWWLSETYFEKGNYEKALYYSHQAILLEDRGLNWPSFFNIARICAAKAGVMLDETREDMQSLYGYASENRLRVYDGWISRNIGEILLIKAGQDRQAFNGAEGWLVKAIEADKKNGTMFSLGRDHLSYAELLKRKGDMAGARENLVTAAEIFKSCGADGWQHKAEKEFSSLT